MAKYICQESQHNKVWEYIQNGGTVTFKWGRVGGTTQEKTKNFGSSFSAQDEINRLIREKQGKGYKLVNDTQLKKEVDLAQSLGTRFKVSKIQWVRRKGNELVSMLNYDASQYVYVEVMNSWTKATNFYLLHKDNSWVLSGVSSISDIGETKYRYSNMYEIKDQTVLAVRNYLKELFAKVVEALKTVKVGGLGLRKLFDDSTNATPQEVEDLSVDFAGAEKGVISKFATMGMRVLEL